MVSLRPINEANFLEAISLRVRPEQKDFVASAVGILARAYAYRDSRAAAWGIYAEERIVGLMMVHDLTEEPACYHLCEFLIDQKEQGKGYGQHALALLLTQCARERKFSAIEVCVKKADAQAIHVYEKAGFHDTGYQDPETPDSCCMAYQIPESDGLEIRYRDIILRDMRESDIEDDIRWNTVETQWALWDAPWEMAEELAKFDPEQYRREQLKKLQAPREEFRWHFELDTADGVHIGAVNSYLIDENWDWIALRDVKPGQKTWRTLGIEINESRFWSKGLGTQAMTAFIRYYLEQGQQELCLQTWSGNVRMIRCAEKLGFVECNREIGFRKVRGGTYDGLTFCLDLDVFNKFLRENS